MSETKLPPIDLQRPGRMISLSKSGYALNHRGNLLAFNGIYTKTEGHLWSGDLDVTRDMSRLKEIASNLGQDLYILRDVQDRTPENVPWENAIAIIKVESNSNQE